MATKLKNNKWFIFIVSLFVLLGLSVGMISTYPQIFDYVEKNHEKYYDQFDMYSQLMMKNYLTYMDALEEEQSDYIGLVQELYGSKGKVTNLKSACETLFEIYSWTDETD